MTSADEIKRRIEVAIPQSRAQVSDLTGGGDHFRCEVVAAEFAGMSRIEQHRRIYEIFSGEIGGAIHALSLKTSAQ
jgi:stress-induced morphogen